VLLYDELLFVRLVISWLYWVKFVSRGWWGYWWWLFFRHELGGKVDVLVVQVLPVGFGERLWGWLLWMLLLGLWGC
jgi:hypothetical protein